MGGCCSCGNSSKPYIQYKYSPLTKPSSQIQPYYNVIVIGSGYGGSVAACRSARAGQSVCVLEKGQEWLPGDFPETMEQAFRVTHISRQGDKKAHGHPSSLFQFQVSKDITVMTGSGVGGSSLIDEGVALDCKAKIFYDPVWPQVFREDIDNFKTYDRAYAEQMLRPVPYPDEYPQMNRINQLRNVASNIQVIDIEDMNESFFRTPLCINFQDAPANHVGMPQSACNGCGNCLSGCNTGAKNTLAMNYIPDAVRHGAGVFTQIEVTSIIKDYENYQWQVFYRHLDENSSKEEKSIRANFVIISAGALGSSKILLQSRERGLEVSSETGRKFNGNGGMFGVSYNGKESSNAVGLRTGMFKSKPKPKDGIPSGPAATAFIDARKRRDGFVMHDVTVPGAYKAPYIVASAIASNSLQVSEFPAGGQWENLLQRLDQQPVSNSLGLYCMTKDEADGEIIFDRDTGKVHVEWDKQKHEKYYYTVRKALEEACQSLGGACALNPKWSNNLGAGVFTRHPLGGCCMGESGGSGVVNHKGQVFIGDSEEVYDGLYVIDGSIIPCALGVNPAFTTACIAERCMRLLAQDERWNMDYSMNYNNSKRPDQSDTAV